MWWPHGSIWTGQTWPLETHSGKCGEKANGRRLNDGLQSFALLELVFMNPYDIKVLRSRWCLICMNCIVFYVKFEDGLSISVLKIRVTFYEKNWGPKPRSFFFKSSNFHNSSGIIKGVTTKVFNIRRVGILGFPNRKILETHSNHIDDHKKQID